MRIDGLSLDFFRNYVHLDAAFDPNINVIYGDNAQGKTNLLEAVAYLSGVSHRARYDRELIQFGVDHAFLKGNVFARERDFLLEAELHRAAEIASRQCLSGPHKDDLLVEIDEKAAKSYASQGQTRTAALSLKLAAREIFQQDTGEYPVLLLDDVLSELDPRRQEFVLNRIRGGQVFITCCEDDRLPQLLGGRIFHVKNGTVR